MARVAAKVKLPPPPSCSTPFSHPIPEMGTVYLSAYLPKRQGRLMRLPKTNARYSVRMPMPHDREDACVSANRGEHVQIVEIP